MKMATASTDDFTSTFYSTEDVTGSSTNSNEDFTTTESYTDGATVPPLITPVIRTTDQLIIFFSVIVGVLGWFLILAIVGWVADEFGVFGDGMYEFIRSFSKKTTDAKTEFGPFPKVSLKETTDPDLPSWIRRQRSSRRRDVDGNSLYETVGEATVANQYATGHTNEQFHHDDEFSEDDQEEYDEITAEQEAKHAEIQNLKPSEVARREKKQIQQNKKQEPQNAYETEIPDQGGCYESPSPAPGGPTYQLSIPGGNEEEYGGSLYSNSSMIPPVILPRDAK